MMNVTFKEPQNNALFRHAIFIFILLAAGCSGILPEPPASPRQFDFGPPPALSATVALPDNLVLGGVTTASWIDNNAIHYRLLFDQPLALRGYAEHAWVAPPAELVARRISGLLFNAPPSPAPRVLRVELDAFEQVFDSPQSAHVEARLRATITGAADNASFRREFSGRRPAAADVQGAVGTLPALADELILRVLEWAASL